MRIFCFSVVCGNVAVLHRDLGVFNHLQEGIDEVPTKAIVVMVGQSGYCADARWWVRFGLTETERVEIWRQSSNATVLVIW
ncbi:unnamed protein product [Linum trigynum]|uniref:Uncharacterized protein n=1 Tax=Linum trigynum TaxID=586398 RepID=A0AAV2DI68_9ROSI